MKLVDVLIHKEIVSVPEHYVSREHRPSTTHRLGNNTGREACLFSSMRKDLRCKFTHITESACEAGGSNGPKFGYALAVIIKWLNARFDSCVAWNVYLFNVKTFKVFAIK